MACELICVALRLSPLLVGSSTGKAGCETSARGDCLMSTATVQSDHDKGRAGVVDAPLPHCSEDPSESIPLVLKFSRLLREDMRLLQWGFHSFSSTPKLPTSQPFTFVLVYQGP